jgi:protein-L-isoaspartate(D-aspartate) O-methyltransferase
MNTATDATPEDLRARMVDRILARKPLSAEVEAALRHVQRHRYIPETSTTDAYDDKAVITHTFPDGTHLSCASEPVIVAAMLNALHVRPGHRILEIGAGTGYNAALLATLTGPDGRVTTLDINTDVTTNARRNLDTTGFNQVQVLTRDGDEGAAEQAPFDRIIVTVGAWDIPSSWWNQLAPGARLVVPLRWRGTTRAVAFVKRDDHWQSDWMMLCGFVPMLGQPGERNATIDAKRSVTLHYDMDQPVDINALQDVLDREKSQAWSEATVHGEEPFDRVWLRLAATDNGTVRIQAHPDAVASGLSAPAIPSRSPALVHGSSLAYLAIRRTTNDPSRWQLGAIGHGPQAPELAARIINQIDNWHHHRTADPQLLAYPTDLPMPDIGGNVITKSRVRLVMGF